MKITVLLFGRLRDTAAGASPQTIEFPPGTGLKNAVNQVLAGKAQGGEAVALNGRITRGDPELAEGDEIVVLPPVSGG